MIRGCQESDLEAILAIINSAAEAYRTFIPANQWKAPYMQEDELSQEINAGIRFSGFENRGALKGVMGVQKVKEVTLIRHAFVARYSQRCGIGSALLTHISKSIADPILIGTWADASWAISFYEKHGFRNVGRENTVHLLHKYWTVPETQIKTSVVLANPAWFETRHTFVS